ncbi:2-nitropropane dioxygenase [Mycena belliarum]|uniref:2-nitropropane dioxygenase n=1 Tax=Mycena belliarum TaxID=1033014 RepID=A0AAD6U714_9AGAR|nr:2-nitropropane dioxygenase [Mycena belliae]
MEPICTKLTQLLDLRSPIVSAPMAFASTPSLAAAVSAAGGLGMIAGDPTSLAHVKEQLNAVRASLNISKNQPIPVGVGFIGWRLDKPEVSGDGPISCKLLNVLEEMPVAIWLAQGVDMGKYVAQIRAYDANRAHKTCVFVMVNCLDEALCAANDWKADVIVVQGIEAGGHCHSKAPPLLTLLEAVRTAIPSSGPCILAAGGVSSGAQIAALLTMGADGVVLGTRFVCTHECMYPDSVKNLLVESGIGSTTCGTIFDEVIVMPFKVEFPEGFNGRGITNKIVDDASAGLSIEERRKRVHDAKTRGDTDRMVIWAGEGVGLIKKTESTADVFAQLHRGAVATLERSRRLLV